MKEIFTRRSIRKYEKKPVTDDQVKQLLKAAMYAPSAGNEQPWHFVVVRDRERLDEIARRHPFAGMLKEAPLAIIPCCDTGIVKYKGMFGSRVLRRLFKICYCRQNIWGWVAVGVGLSPQIPGGKGGKNIESTPDIVPAAMIAIGYPGEKVEAPNRFIPERIHLEQW